MKYNHGIRLKSISITGVIFAVAAKRRHSCSAPPNDIVVYLRQFGDHPCSKIVENETTFPPPAILFLKAQQSSAVLSVLGIICILWAFPCLQLQFLVAFL